MFGVENLASIFAVSPFAASTFAVGILVVSLFAISIPPSLAIDSVEAAWKELPVKRYLDHGKDIRYCETEEANHTKVTLIVVPLSKSFEIRPVLNAKTCPTSETASKEGALACINGSFFNLQGGASTGASTAYITVNGQTVCTPKENKALTKNIKLKPFLNQIYERSELRFIADSKGKIMVRIQPHSEPVPEGFTLKHSIQAGPRLLPTITAREEAFIRKEPDGSETDSIGCLRTAARTAIGITPDEKMILVCVAGPKQDEFSAGMTLEQLANFMKKMGCVSAINFDGGTSTTMVLKNQKGTDAKTDRTDKTEKAENDAGKTGKSDKLSAGIKPGDDYSVVCGRVPETNVKSCLIVRKAP
jgi:hypothetical protein